jgi:hypothetical protein
MPKVNLSNYGPFALKPGEKLLEELNRFLVRMGPGGSDDIKFLKYSVKSGIQALKQLNSPERNIGDGLFVPHNSFWFSEDADSIEKDLDTISNFRNPSAGLAALGDSFVPEVLKALSQLVTLLRQKKRKLEEIETKRIMEMIGGGRRRTRNARNRSARNRNARNRNARKTHSARQTRRTRKRV